MSGRDALDALEWFEKPYPIAEPGAVCVECGSDMAYADETDYEGVFWTYCKPCDFWTEHGTGE